MPRTSERFQALRLAPDSWRELYKNTLAEVRSGEIPQTRIDDAVTRILRVKTMAGLFKRPAPCWT